MREPESKYWDANSYNTKKKQIRSRTCNSTSQHTFEKTPLMRIARIKNTAQFVVP